MHLAYSSNWWQNVKSPLEMCAVRDFVRRGVGRMFGGPPHLLCVFYRRTTCERWKCSEWEQDGSLIYSKMLECLSVKQRNPAYVKVINTSAYLQQPDNRGFVNKKCVDPPNIRPTPRLTKSLTAHISRGESVNPGITPCPKSGRMVSAI